MIEQVKDYLVDLRKRWCIWHVAMTIMAFCFFLETSIIFGELYWWKYTAKPGSIEGLVSNTDFDAARLYHLSALSSDFAQKFLKYGWYTAMVGFGWIEGLWNTFANWSCIRRPLHIKGRSKTKAILGCVFFAIFLIFDRILIPIVTLIIMTLINGGNPLKMLNRLSIDPSKTIQPAIYAVILALLERKIPMLVYVLATTVSAIYDIIQNCLFIVRLRTAATPIASAQGFSVQQEVLDLCKQVGFNSNHAYLLQGGNNAFFAGFGVLSSFFLLSGILGLPKRQILAIAAHELGHWKWGHVAITIIMSILETAITLGAFYLFRQRHWYRKFVDMHFDDPLEVPFGLSFTIFTIIFVPVEVIMTMLGNMIHWWQEIAADNFSIALGYAPDLILGLAELAKDNVEMYYRSPIFGLFYNHHPPMNVRFNLIRGRGMFQ